jgi:hypothetical protein
MPRATDVSVIHFCIAIAATLLLLAPDAPAFDKRTSAFWQNLSAGRTQRLVLSGTSLSNTTYSPWPDSLKATLDSLMGVGLLDLRNISPEGGNTSMAGPNCADSLHLITDLAPNAVFLEFASNDATNHYDCTIDSCSRPSHIRMIEGLRQSLPACEIFLYITARPWDADTCPSTTPCAYCTVFLAQYCRRAARPSNNDHVEKYFDMVRELADRYHTHLIDTYADFKAIYDTAFASYVDYLFDGHHPSPQATHEIIMPHMLQALRGWPLVITAPATGDTIFVGDSVTVGWEFVPSDSATSLDVDISPDGGSTWLTAPTHRTSSIPVTEHRAVFVMPSEIGGIPMTTNQVFVRITQYNGTTTDAAGPLVVRPLSAVRGSRAVTGARRPAPFALRLTRDRTNCIVVAADGRCFDIRGSRLAGRARVRL